MHNNVTGAWQTLHCTASDRYQDNRFLQPECTATLKQAGLMPQISSLCRAAWYMTRLLARTTPKGVVFSGFSFLSSLEAT